MVSVYCSRRSTRQSLAPAKTRMKIACSLFFNIIFHAGRIDRTREFTWLPFYVVSPETQVSSVS